MTFKHKIAGIILSLSVMLTGVQLFYFLPESRSAILSATHLLISFAFICILSALCKRKNLRGMFKYSYITLAIPYIIGFLAVVAVNLQQLDNAFLNSSGFDDFTYLLLFCGLASVVDVVGTIRIFYDAADMGFTGFDIPDTFLVFVITAILLITPLLIYKSAKAHSKPIQENE